MSARRRYEPRAWLDLDTTPLPSMVVHERCDEPIATGIVDADGTPLWRMPEPRLPIGFHLPKPRVRVKAGR